MNSHYVAEYDGGHCNYLDQCVLHHHTAEDVFAWLLEDFNRHYLQNKAPYLMPFHTSWFHMEELRGGLHKFIRHLTTL